MEDLPQFMQVIWPWVLWIGGTVAVFIGIGTLGGMASKWWHERHKEESDDG